MIDPLNFLSNDNFRVYLVEVGKVIDVYPSIFLNDLIDCHKHHMKNGELTSDSRHGSGWFFYTHEKGFDRTGLRKSTQNTCAKKLSELGLIEYENFNKDNRRHYRLNLQAISEFIYEIYSHKPEKRPFTSFQAGCQKSNNGLSKSANPYIDKNTNQEVGVYKTTHTAKSPRVVDKKLVSSLTHKKVGVPSVDRWKLSQEQMDTYFWLKELGIGAKDTTLSWWARTYQFEALKNIYNYAVSKKATNIGAYMALLLKKDAKVGNRNVEINTATAKQFAEEMRWMGVKIGKKYLVYATEHGTSEIPLWIDNMNFYTEMHNAWAKRHVD